MEVQRTCSIRKAPALQLRKLSNMKQKGDLKAARTGKQVKKSRINNTKQLAFKTYASSMHMRETDNHTTQAIVY